MVRAGGRSAAAGVPRRWRAVSRNRTPSLHRSGCAPARVGCGKLKVRSRKRKITRSLNAKLEQNTNCLTVEERSRRAISCRLPPPGEVRTRRRIDTEHTAGQAGYGANIPVGRATLCARERARRGVGSSARTSRWRPPRMTSKHASRSCGTRTVSVPTGARPQPQSSSRISKRGRRVGPAHLRPRDHLI